VCPGTLILIETATATLRQMHAQARAGWLAEAAVDASCRRSSRSLRHMPTTRRAGLQLLQSGTKMFCSDFLHQTAASRPVSVRIFTGITDKAVPLRGC